jgi:myosin-crossreactive antigen
MDSTPIHLDEFIQEGALAAPHLDAIKEILEADLFEDQMGSALRDYVKEHFHDIEFYSVVCAMLAATKIISAYNFRRALNS